jgi:hypothetical protein
MVVAGVGSGCRRLRNLALGLQHLAELVNVEELLVNGPAGFLAQLPVLLVEVIWIEVLFIKGFAAPGKEPLYASLEVLLLGPKSPVATPVAVEELGIPELGIQPIEPVVDEHQTELGKPRGIAA